MRAGGQLVVAIGEFQIRFVDQSGGVERAAIVTRKQASRTPAQSS